MKIKIKITGNESKKGLIKKIISNLSIVVSKEDLLNFKEECTYADAKNECLAMVQIMHLAKSYGVEFLYD